MAWAELEESGCADDGCVDKGCAQKPSKKPRRTNVEDDITNVCRDASMNGMRRKIAGKRPEEIRNMSSEDMAEPITMADFLQATNRISPSVSKEDIKKHEQWRDEYGSS